MSPDAFEMYDGAYVLGALTAAERQRFEAHLAGCDACMLRVAELWALPDLLAAVPAAAVEQSLSGDVGWDSLVAATRESPTVTVAPLPETLLPRLLAQTRAHQRGARLRTVTAGVAVAACLAGLGVFALDRPSADPERIPSAAVALRNVADKLPLTADVQVVSTHSWDQVNLWCTYRKDAPYREGNYQAVAYDVSGRRQVVGVWPAIPGQTTVLRVPTTFRTGTIAKVAILTATGETLAGTRVEGAR